jgi:hypothetical protein
MQTYDECIVPARMLQLMSWRVLFPAGSSGSCREPADENNPEYIAEVNEYLRSPLFKSVIDTTVEKVVELLTNPLYCQKDVYSVFIAGDNHHVNLVLRSRLEAETRVNLIVMMLRQEGEIAHITNKNHDIHLMATLAFDWYLISMANFMLGFRIRHYEGGVLTGSSFGASAEAAGFNLCLEETQDSSGHIHNPRGFFLRNDTALNADSIRLHYALKIISHGDGSTA